MRSGNKNMNFVSFEDESDKSDSQTANIQAMLNSELDRTIMIDKFIELKISLKIRLKRKSYLIL